MIYNLYHILSKFQIFLIMFWHEKKSLSSCKEYKTTGTMFIYYNVLEIDYNLIVIIIFIYSIV